MYNYREVRPLVDGYPFSTQSDTEVLIAAYAKWGPDCIKYFRGMFSFVIWDRQEQTVFMARDRMGVKPLYYFKNNDVLLFASEVRAILATGLVRKEINRSALIDYFNYQSVSYPDSLIQDVSQLEAGTWMMIRKGKPEKK